jgi:hypothetical protein
LGEEEEVEVSKPSEEQEFEPGMEKGFSFGD